MKLLFYNEENNIVDVVENISNPIIDGQDIQWENGRIEGVNLSFILVDDTVTFSDRIESYHILQDKKPLYLKTKDNEELKKQIESVSKDFQDFMDFFFSQ